MANAGDSYQIELKETHINWGQVRYTGSRAPIPGEGYIPIPANVAYSLKLFNSNGTNGMDIYGDNLFYCRSSDGFFRGVLRAQGNQDRSIFAKQFSADGDLRAIGQWYADIGAVPGDVIQVTWLNPTDIIIEKL